MSDHADLSERPHPLVEVHDDAAALAAAVAGELLNRIADGQAAGDVPQICLTGGRIADAVHHEIVRLAPASGVDWGAVDLWWSDERYVAADSPDRNANQARAAFIDAVGVPDHRVHEFPATDASGSAGSVDEAARAHAAVLGERTFDVVLLGVGEDAHVGALFPGFPQLDAEGTVVAVTGAPKPPSERLTLTFDALNRTEVVWLVASGQAKAEPVRRSLATDGALAETPARGVRGRQETTWFLDRESAALL